MNTNISSGQQLAGLAAAGLTKEKLQPFGSHFLVKLDEANYKLTCNLSAKPGPITSDWMTDGEVVGK